MEAALGEEEPTMIGSQDKRMDRSTRDYWELIYSRASRPSVDFFTKGHESYLEDFVAKYLHSSRPLLLLGCGGGRNGGFLSRRGFEVTYLDLAHSALELVKEDGAQLVQANMVKLPFAENHFGGALCLHVLDHLPLEERSVALRELRATLQENSPLLFAFDPPEEEGGQAYENGLVFHPHTEKMIRDLLGEALVQLTKEKNGSHIAIARY